MRHSLSILRFLVLVLAALGFGPAGCVSTPDDPPLEASLVNLHFRDVTVFETVALAEVRLTNLTGDDHLASGASYKVVVNGVNLGRGVSAETFTVPRLGTAIQEVEFHLRNFSLAHSIHQISRSQVIDYQLDGTVYARRGVEGGRERKVKVRRTGQLDLREMIPSSQ